MKKYIIFFICVCVVQSFTSCEKSDKPLLTFVIEEQEIFLTESDFLALSQTERFLSRTNSHGIATDGTYKGVEWNILAQSLNFDAEKPATLIASDGFEVQLTSKYLNEEESLFALYQDGEYIKSKDNGRVWFCVGKTFTANFWVKYIEKIIIE